MLILLGIFRWIFHLTLNFPAWRAVGTVRTAAIGQKQTFHAMTSSMHVEFHLETDTSKTAHGELVVSAYCGSFSGKGSAWFTSEDIIEFGRLLQDTFPIQAGRALQLQGGQFSDDGTILERRQVCLKASPFGGTGVIVVDVELATGDEEHHDSSVKLSLRTHYEALRRFGTSICLLGDGAASSALLLGDD